LKEHRKLTKLQYFEWAISIEKLNHAKTIARLATAEAESQGFKAQVENLKYHLVKAKAVNARSGIEAAEKAYEAEKKGLEKKLGISLSDKIINENREIISGGTEDGTDNSSKN